MRLNVKDRIKLAMKGDREARNILMRDPNRLVSQAVVTNPKITEQEIETISAMRSVPEDVLRQIAINRQWARSYKISLNLARNPRTPIANAMPILARMVLPVFSTTTLSVIILRSFGTAAGISTSSDLNDFRVRFC